MFAVRCLYAALASGEGTPNVPIPLGRAMTVVVKRRGKIEYEASDEVAEHRQCLDGADAASDDAWQLAAWLLAIRVIGRIELPQLPPEVVSPVYREGSVDYCKIGDLPKDALQEFRKFRQNQQKKLLLEIPGVSDAVVPEYMEKFWCRLEGLDG